MSGGSSSSQTTITQPWGPTIKPLRNITSQVGALANTTGVTPDQSAAFNAIKANAGLLNQQGQNYASTMSNLYSGGGYGSTTGLLNDNWNAISGALSPYTSANYADPTQNPIYQRMADLAANGAQNSVNGMFAAAGRSMSGAHAGALGKGITDAMTGVYANGQGQLANQQLQGLGLLNTAGQGTSSALEGIQGQKNAAALSAAGLNSSLPGILNQGSTNTINADLAKWSMPVQQLGMLSNLLVPIAGLGGVSTSQTKTQSDPVANAIGGGLGLAALMSDRRVKRDIEQVGTLFDGTPVYRFRYFNDPRWHIGLMAQDVEQFAPNAVLEIGGVKHVDYRAATERAVEAA